MVNKRIQINFNTTEDKKRDIKNTAESYGLTIGQYLELLHKTSKSARFQLELTITKKKKGDKNYGDSKQIFNKL